MAYDKADWVCGGWNMKKKVIVGIMGVIAILLIFLTPGMPFDEAIAGIAAVIIAMK